MRRSEKVGRRLRKWRLMTFKGRLIGDILSGGGHFRPIGKPETAQNEPIGDYSQNSDDHDWSLEREQRTDIHWIPLFHCRDFCGVATSRLG